MREFVLVACMWLHTFAAVIWIGGIFFLIGIVLPALNNHGGTHASEVMKNIGKRFTPMANASIGIVLATGLLLLMLSSTGQGLDHFLYAKIAIFVVMVSIHCWRIFALPGRVARAESELQRSRWQRMSLALVRVNLCLGVIALLFTAAAGS
jgi:uncharacterized membrane protein